MASNGGVPKVILEAACAAYWNHHLDPGQYNWEWLVKMEDSRVEGIRAAMEAALLVAYDEFMELEVGEIVFWPGKPGTDGGGLERGSKG